MHIRILLLIQHILSSVRSAAHQFQCGDKQYSSGGGKCLSPRGQDKESMTDPTLKEVSLVQRKIDV